MVDALSLIGQVQRLRRLQASRAADQPTAQAPSTEGILDFIPRANRRYQAPRHLAPLVEVLERGVSEPIRALVDVPRRHAKTETILYTAAWLLRHHPEKTIGYASYSADFARSKSRTARDIALQNGVSLRHDSKSAGEWVTTAGGGFIAGGIGGSWTGRGVDWLIVDDPHKNRAEAESQVYRDAVEAWFRSAGISSVEPGGSVFVVHTRWHSDDLIGRCDGDTEVTWQHIHLPAINDDGEALWPDRWPVEALERRRREVGEYEWASLYQGRPTPRGSEVFVGANFYAEAPRFPAVAIGIDLAYTSKKTSDYSVALVLAEWEGKYYVLDVVRLQVKAPEFAAELESLASRWPGAPMVAYVGGTEMGVIDLLSAHGVNISATPARADKFVRAQPAAAAWNRGDILIPNGDIGGAWVNKFVSELRGFTGINDKHDDQVDALAGAFDALSSGSSDASVMLVPSMYD